MRLLILLVVLALTGCVEETKYVKEPTAIRAEMAYTEQLQSTAGFEGCIVTLTNSVNHGDLWVVRCPNSTTSAKKSGKAARKTATYSE